MKKIFEFISRKTHLSPSQLVASVATALLGLILLIAPGTATAFVFNIIGAIFILIGLINIVRYFLMDIRASILSNALTGGLIWIIIGVAIILFKGSLISMLPFFFGLIVLIGGVAKLRTALNFRRMNVRKWQFELILALISIVFGAVILLNPFSTAMLLMRVIGTALLIEGVSNLISFSAFKKAKDDFIEAELKDAE